MIANSQTQIRNHLGSDGVISYIDPDLEAEALGGKLDWGSGGEQASLSWPDPARKGLLPEYLASPDLCIARGRVRVALDVIRRLKALERGDYLVTGAASGPLTLAARLTQLGLEDPLFAERLPDAALNVAAAVLTAVSTAFVEAGASLVFIHEPLLPALTTERCEAWASSMDAAFNIIRFYRALPVLIAGDPGAFAANAGLILRRDWNCVICLMPGAALPRDQRPGSLLTGIALPVDLTSAGPGGDEFEKSLDTIASEFQPVIVTTRGDVPAGADIRRIKALFSRPGIAGCEGRSRFRRPTGRGE
jgi:hypothetical protein